MSTARPYATLYAAYLHECRTHEIELSPAGAFDYATEALTREIERLQTMSDNYCALLMDANQELAALKAQPSGVVSWLPIDTAPRDGSLLRLLVEFEDNATEDQEGPCPTVGANNYENDGEDVWLFAGWDWSHDLFTQGIGRAIGWLPMLENLNQPASAGDERAAFEAELQILGFTRKGLATLRCGGEYLNEKVQACWALRKARAAPSAGSRKDEV